VKKIFSRLWPPTSGVNDASEECKQNDWSKKSEIRGQKFTMLSLNKRIYSSLVLASVLALMLLRTPILIVFAMLVMIIIIAMLEFYFIIRQIGIPAYRYIGIACGIVLTGVTFYTFIFNNGANKAEYELAVIFASFAAVCIRQFPQKLNDQPMTTIACTMLGILYIPFLFNFFIKLGLAWDHNDLFSSVNLTGRLLCFYLIAVVKCTDIGAFLIGSRFGKHKLFPRISPAKTWEGFGGGLLFGLVVSLALFAISHGHFGHKIMTFQDAVILGLSLPLLGTTGDLVESLLKRAGGAKDTGTYIPGMGGMLDVLDSVLFAVPFFYFYTLWFLPSLL
jgi:phosphatidate cytidylyltransferase